MNTAARMMQKGLPGEVGYISRDFSGNRTRKKTNKIKEGGGKHEKCKKMRMNTSWVRVGYILSGQHMDEWLEYLYHPLSLNDQIIF